MMRFKHDTKVDGRTQSAHVSSVHVVPKGMKVSEAPWLAAISFAASL